MGRGGGACLGSGGGAEDGPGGLVWLHGFLLAGCRENGMELNLNLAELVVSTAGS